MAQITTTIPQAIDPFNFITLGQVMAVLPETIPFTEVIGIGGKICQGKQITNLIFQVRQDDQPSQEMKMWANSIAQQASGGVFSGTMANDWRNRLCNVIWIYADGEKILGNDLVYTKAPPAIDLPLEITWQMVLSRLPQTIPYNTTLWATGGIVREGRSFNDFDIIAGNIELDANGAPTITEKIEVVDLLNMRNFFNKQINLGVTVFDSMSIDIGNRIMTEREPVYLCKLYENGQLVYGV